MVANNLAFLIAESGKMKFDGFQQYKQLLINQFGSIEQAIAQNTIFPPVEIAELQTWKLFPAVRNTSKFDGDRGSVSNFNVEAKFIEQYDNKKDIKVILDDNAIPHHLFCSCFKAERIVKSTTLNHIYKSANNGPYYHSNLQNLCLTPFYLAKLTDADAGIKKLLRYRIQAKYGFAPEGKIETPANYDDLMWLDECHIYKEICCDVQEFAQRIKGIIINKHKMIKENRIAKALCLGCQQFNNICEEIFNDNNHSFQTFCDENNK